MRFGQNQAHRLLKGGINRQIVTARLSLNNSPQTVTESREAPVVTSEKGISCHYFKLLFLRSIHARRGFGHEVLGGGGFGEGDYFAQGFFAGEEHGYAVDAQGYSAVGRGAVG